MKRWSIRYYNDTATAARASAMNRQAANGGLGEYYSEADTRIPTWLIAGVVVSSEMGAAVTLQLSWIALS